MIQGAIFDFDGTLFDSMFIWETAGETYLRTLGIEPKEDLQKVLKSMSLFQSACYCKAEYGLPLSVPEIMDGVNRTVEDYYFHTVLPKPGVAPLLERLREQGVKLCIATATDRYQVEAALKRCGMERFFSEILTCTAVGHGKDEPFIYRQALRHLQTGRRNTIVVEDAYYAIRTAKADGFITVAVYDPYETRQEEVRAMADCFLPDYAQSDIFWKFASAL